MASWARHISAVLFLAARPCAAENDKAGLEFLAEEARVVTASRRATSIRGAPATVYVLTGERLRALGVQNLWEGLRTVPGLEVLQTRSFQGEVGGRGFSGPMNKRALVLLDGRTVLNGFYDFTLWEAIPVELEEIDRIEVVVGPASALYGPNALSGVINIITKTPESLGSAVEGAVGSRSTRWASAVHGRRAGPWALKASTGWRSGNRSSDDPEMASETGKGSFALWRDLGAGEAGLSAGLARHRTQFSASTLGAPYDDGTTGFLRGDWRRGSLRLRSFWNFGRTTFRGTSLGDTGLEYDTVDVEAQQELELPFEQRAVAGAGYRRNASRSAIFGPDQTRSQDLWSAFFEDRWAPSELWSATVSGRIDRHPEAGLSVSPRGSVTFIPEPSHSVRLSGGTSFRNPTLAENYLQLRRTVSGVSITSAGSEDLAPERLAQAELAHLGRFGALSTRLQVFHWRARDVIVFRPLGGAGASPTSLTAQSFSGAKAWGGEAAVEWSGPPGLTAFANHSYQSVRTDSHELNFGAPRHKSSFGVLGKRGGWSASLWANWSGRAFFRTSSELSSFVTFDSVADRWLVSGRAGYAFSGDWSWLEIWASVHDLGDREHYQLAPALGGEVVRARVLAGVTCRFD